MTDAEILILRTKLQAETNPAIVAARDARNDTECANLLNAATASVIWRNNVTRAEIYHSTSDATLAGGTPTTWNWTTYKNQSVPETLGCRGAGTSEAMLGTIIEATMWSGTLPSRTQGMEISRDYYGTMFPRRRSALSRIAAAAGITGPLIGRGRLLNSPLIGGRLAQ